MGPIRPSRPLVLGLAAMYGRPPRRARGRYSGGSPAPRSPGSLNRKAIAPLPALILGVFAALAVALFVGVVAVFASYASGLPDPSQLEHFELSQGSSVMSADGVELATFAAEERRVLTFDKIPQVMADAEVAAEDRTFWTNPCIDFKGIVRAALQNFSASETV